MGDIAARLKTVRDRDGCGAVGVYAGNPASFATLHYSYASSFGRALGPAKIFNALHVDTGAKNLAQELLFGSPVHWTFPDLEECRSEERGVGKEWGRTCRAGGSQSHSKKKKI